MERLPPTQLNTCYLSTPLHIFLPPACFIHPSIHSPSHLSVSFHIHPIRNRKNKETIPAPPIAPTTLTNNHVLPSIIRARSTPSLPHFTLPYPHVCLSHSHTGNSTSAPGSHILFTSPKLNPSPSSKQK
jgi:hypothetical protein